MNEEIKIPDEVRTFLEGLLSDAGMTTLDDQMKEEMIKELYARLDSFITSSIVANLPPEHLDAFIKLNEEKKTQAEIEGFLTEKMPNAKDIFTKAFSDFRALYLGNVSVSRNTPEGNSPAPDQPKTN